MSRMQQREAEGHPYKDRLELCRACSEAEGHPYKDRGPVLACQLHPKPTATRTSDWAPAAGSRCPAPVVVLAGRGAALAAAAALLLAAAVVVDAAGRAPPDSMGAAAPSPARSRVACLFTVRACA